MPARTYIEMAYKHAPLERQLNFRITIMVHNIRHDKNLENYIIDHRIKLMKMCPYMQITRIQWIMFEQMIYVAYYKELDSKRIHGL